MIVDMKRLKVVLGKILYNVIGKHLPVAHCLIKPIGVISKKFRELCGKLILQQCGNNVNIYPKAEFSSKVTLGDNSDIGYAARINGTCVIGNDVIMGPEVLIYTVVYWGWKLDLRKGNYSSWGSCGKECNSCSRRSRFKRCSRLCYCCWKSCVRRKAKRYGNR